VGEEKCPILHQQRVDIDPQCTRGKKGNDDYGCDQARHIHDQAYGRDRDNAACENLPLLMANLRQLSLQPASVRSRIG